MDQRFGVGKVTLSELAALPLSKEENFGSTILSVGNNSFSRLSVIGTVISKEGSDRILLDDTTTQMSCRVFDNSTLFSDVVIGDVAHIIGRPREYLGERYLLAEVLKKVDGAWLEVRKKELSKRELPQAVSAPPKPIQSFPQEVVLESEEVAFGSVDPLIEFIRKHDDGSGVDIEKIITESKVNGAEDEIDYLLKNGDIFEIRPGRVKVLE